MAKAFRDRDREMERHMRNIQLRWQAQNAIEDILMELEKDTGQWVSDIRYLGDCEVRVVLEGGDA